MALCSGCGKEEHFGGCKVGLPTPEEQEALKKHGQSESREKCGICMSPEHEITYCPKATRPRTKP